jgi:hypothetical protein
MRGVFGSSKEFVVVSVQAPGHVFGVHKGDFHIKQLAVVIRE